MVITIGGTPLSLLSVPAHLLLDTSYALPANTTAVKHTLLSRTDASETEYPGTVGAVTSLDGGGADKYSLIDAANPFEAAMVGATLRSTSGANLGAWRVITTFNGAANVYTDAFDNDFVVGDTFIIERINTGWQHISWWLDTGAKCYVSFAGSAGARPTVESSLSGYIESLDPITYVWFQTISGGVEDQSAYNFNAYGW